MERVSDEALSAFAVFAEHLNLTKAAAALHISQPSLHAKLAALARRLDRPLYERVGRRLVLTPEGEAVARFARDRDERLVRFLDELHALPTTRPIVLAAGHSAYLHILGEVIRSTLARRPGSLRLMHTHRHQMLAAVRTGRAQLGVATLDTLPDDLETVPVATYPSVLLCPTGHPLAGRTGITLADLAGAELVVPPPARPLRITLEKALRDAGVSWHVAVEAEGWPLTVHFAALGVGLAVVAGCIEPAPGLVAVPIADLIGVTYHAAYRPGALDDPRVADLLDAVLRHVRPA